MTPIQYASKKWNDIEGGIVAPAILYMLGVPLFLVILLWFFFFRG